MVRKESEMLIDKVYSATVKGTKGSEKQKRERVRKPGEI